MLSLFFHGYNHGDNVVSPGPDGDKTDLYLFNVGLLNKIRISSNRYDVAIMT